MKKYAIYLLLIFFISSCNKNQKGRINTQKLKIIEAKGYVFPKDSTVEPEVIPVDESNLKKIPLGNPKVVLTNLNVHIAGEPKVVRAGKPKICTPGEDSFLLPKKVQAMDSSFTAGIPEVVVAKDAYTKDQNSQNFSSFSKLQGLTHTNITYIYEDFNGNLWFGTGGGGISKFNGNTFTHFTEKEGLANNFVTSILQDKSGNLWFGTENGGVSIYDGKNFKNFTEKQGLTNNYITCILQDKSGNIWLGSRGGGLSKYDGSSFLHFTEKQGLANNFVSCIFEDKSGNILIGTRQGGVSFYDGKSFKNLSEKEGLSNNFITSIFQDNSGNLWLGTNGSGVSKYDGNIITNYTEKEGLSNNFVTSILQDKSGNFWFGTNGGGASEFNYKTFTHFTEKEGLNNNIIRHMIQDKNGIIWLGKGGGGVSKYNKKSFKYFTDKEGLSNSTVLSIIQDSSGKIWFGTEGGGVSIYNGKSFTHFTAKEGLTDNTVYSIIQDKSGNHWFGTATGLTKYDGKSFTQFINIDGLSNNIVYSILEDKKGNLWFGCSDGGGVFKYDGKSFFKYTSKQGLSSNSIRTIFQDDSDNIWFGTYGGGISKYDGKSFIHFTIKQGIPDDYVRSIIQDKFGNLWFGGLGFNGITLFDGKSFTSFTEKEGLSNNVVCSILQDKTGNIWCGTRFGLSKLSIEKLSKINDKIKNKRVIESEFYFESFTYDDGFLGIGCNSNSIFISKDETMWIGANDRLTVCNSSTAGEGNDTIAPIIELTNIELFNENIPWVKLIKASDSILILGNGVAISDFKFDSVSKWHGLPEQLSLAYYNNYLTFNFIGVTTLRPKKVKYQYKLEGADENWSTISNKTSATYGNLPPGVYTFKVKAVNSIGIWSNEYNYTFTIRPPWWQTWWFRTTVGIMIISTIAYYIKTRERKLKKEKEILEKTVEERTAEVVEQKNLIQEKHKEITDSINYAERIQRSFLATKDLLNENLKDYFVFFQPKDVVSGDFYWASKLPDGNFAYTCADSTGHGVPGAIMSILNISSLELAIKEKLTSPSEILNYTRTEIINRLKKDGSEEGGKDGMDCSLIILNKEKTKLTYAAANNPIWIIRENELIELKPDKMPVGKHDKDQNPFTQHEFDLQKGDLIYSLTDGMPDQFGGTKGKKYKYTQLKEFLISISMLSMHEQNQKLKSEFENWKGDLEQVDDVCVIGVKV